MAIINFRLLFIIVVVLAIVIGVFFFFKTNFSFGSFNIPFLSGSSIVYKKACANFATNFLSVHHNLSAKITEENMRDATSKKIQITPKTRMSLADSQNRINAREITMRLNINSNSAFNLTCWVNSSFQGDPNLITSYDILFLNIVSINKERDSFNVKEENY
ncbi:MAG: hypothetical protein LBH40_04250 [Alphaproteobacteria bacterium]|jgi:preprotein translocase subunit SecF|nr:hypothetical protein [Alphaproteobacteria bacterium]